MVDGVPIIQRVYDGFARGDLIPLLESLDPQVEWNEAEHVTFWPGTAFHGPDAIVEGLFARIAPTFGHTWTVHVDRLLTCGDTVIMQGRYRVTARAGREAWDILAALGTWGDRWTDVLPVTVSVPTLVLHGDHDARSPLSVGEALHEAIPGSTLVVLKRVGHVSNIEAPERFNDEVRRFLGSARP